jgi:hypothetical protein
MSDCGLDRAAATVVTHSTHRQGGSIMKRSHRLLALFGAVLSLAATLPVAASARHGHGRDDGAAHVRHHADDGPNHR